MAQLQCALPRRDLGFNQYWVFAVHIVTEWLITVNRAELIITVWCTCVTHAGNADFAINMIHNNVTGPPEYVPVLMRGWA